MLPRKTLRRACGDYEREWNGYFVDRNPDDGWLSHLNALGAFRLIILTRRMVAVRQPPAGGYPSLLAMRDRWHILAACAVRAGITGRSC